MVDTHVEARRYLAPPALGFWRWDPQGEAVVWADGALLAFRAEIVEVIARLAPDGLPPFGAVLLVLAATRKGWGDGSRALANFSTLSTQLAQLEKALPPELLSETFVGLNALHLCRNELADEPQTLAAVPGLVLSDVDIALDAAHAPTAVDLLRAGPDADMLAPRDGSTIAFNNLQHVLKSLLARLRNVSAQTLRLRHRTGIDRLPEPADEPLELEADSARARTLIEQLREDELYAPVGRLARNLMAAIHLPRVIGDPEEMPLGGVSDIANRGQLDRLLTSELAHDDLTLAIRVATNEALYLRREEPPSMPTRQRHVLVDVGVRMWGVPRVLAASLALALCATADDDEVHVWCAGRDGLEPADLTDREGLIVQLARLDTRLDLTDLIAQAAERIETDAADIVVITSAVAAADAAFQRASRQFLPHTVYLCGIDRDGAVSLGGVTNTGVKAMASLRMDIDDVEHVGVKRAAHFDSRIDPTLPALLRQRRMPLLMPHQVDPSRLWAVDGGPTFSLAGDGRLMMWRAKDRGGEEVRSDLINANVYWCSTHAGSMTQAIVGQIGKPSLQLITIDLNDGASQRVDLELQTGEWPLGATLHGGVVLVFYPSAVEALDTGTGRVLGRSNRKMDPAIAGNIGRIVRRGRRTWSCVSFAGAEPVIVTDLDTRGDQFARRDHEQMSDSAWIAFFESPLFEAPVGLDQSGWLRELKEMPATLLRLPVDPMAVTAFIGLSRDRKRIAVRQAVKNVLHTAVYELNTNGFRVITSSTQQPWRHLEAPALTNIVTRSPRVNIEAAFLHLAQGGSPMLGLETRKHRLALRMAPWGQMVFEFIKDATPSVRFKPLSQPAGTGYSLSAATFPDGSRLVLDARGLLHFQSVDKAIPELSIVLDDRSISGWTSDGRYFGDAYYIGNAARSNVQDIYRTTLEPFLRRLR